MADMDTTKGQLVTLLFDIGQFRKQMEDNNVAGLQATSASMEALIDTIDGLVQALVQTPGSDCFTLP